MKHGIVVCLMLCAALLSGSVLASRADSPVGLWNTLDDKTGKQSGVVRLYEENGKLYGKIVKVFPGYKKICQDCPGEMKGKPVTGLRFLWDFVPRGQHQWQDGRIIDPETGDIYRGSITLTDQGNKLLLKGYWLIFWRTQTWVRA